VAGWLPFGGTATGARTLAIVRALRGHLSGALLAAGAPLAQIWPRLREFLAHLLLQPGGTRAPKTGSTSGWPAWPPILRAGSLGADEALRAIATRRTALARRVRVRHHDGGDGPVCSCEALPASWAPR
jgi:hypothetical protein